MSAAQNAVDAALAPFQNLPLFPGIDDPTARQAFPDAIAGVRTQLGRT